MNFIICTVVSQGDVSYIPSTKKEGGQLAKCLIRLKEVGGGKFGNEFACTLFGELAMRQFKEGDLVEWSGIAHHLEVTAGGADVLDYEGAATVEHLAVVGRDGVVGRVGTDGNGKENQLGHQIIFR